jgi:hypothetical protein
MTDHEFAAVIAAVASAVNPREAYLDAERRPRANSAPTTRAHARVRRRPPAGNTMRGAARLCSGF